MAVFMIIVRLAISTFMGVLVHVVMLSLFVNLVVLGRGEWVLS
jgi:hypothetical protein